jgi:hypothetical protein
MKDTVKPEKKYVKKEKTENNRGGSKDDKPRRARGDSRGGSRGRGGFDRKERENHVESMKPINLHKKMT